MMIITEEEFKIVKSGIEEIDNLVGKCWFCRKETSIVRFSERRMRHMLVCDMCAKNVPEIINTNHRIL